MRGRKKSITPQPGLEPHPVEKLMFLAEQMQELSSEVLKTADLVRQEIKQNAKKG